MIADSRRAIALAGVMGGEETGVIAATTDVILESAWFDPAHVRRTARRLGLNSDSSYRFERGVDVAGVIPAAERAAALIAGLAGGSVEATGIAGTAGDGAGRREVLLRYARCASVLGIGIGKARIDSILAGFGLRQTEHDDLSSTWEIPTYRSDLTREVDLIEEVMRVAGMEIIPSRVAARFAESSAADLIHDRNTELRQMLAAQGFFEARTLSLVSAEIEGFQRVRNPLNEEQAVLRPSLLPGLLRVAATNARLGTKDLRLFELGRVFGANEEKTHLALLMTGAIAERSWRDASPREMDLFDLKGVLGAAKLGEVTFGAGGNGTLALALDLFLDGKRAGLAGQLFPGRAKELGLSAPVLVAEVELPAVASGTKGPYTAAPLYPAVARDIALIVPEETPHGKIVEILRQANEPLLESVELFDLFSDPTGEKVPAGRKSLAYSLTYRAKDRTLTADEANAAHARLKELLKAGLEVQFRE